MSLPAIAPRDMIAKKPRHGEPCTRCGVCCVAQLCMIARTVFAEYSRTRFIEGLGPCPALEFNNDGTTSCGLVANPTHYAPELAATHGAAALTEAAKSIIAPLTGCDARINGEPTNHAFNDRMHQWDIEHADEVARAKDLWRIKG